MPKVRVLVGILGAFAAASAAFGQAYYVEEILAALLLFFIAFIVVALLILILLLIERGLARTVTYAEAFLAQTAPLGAGRRHHHRSMLP